MPIEFTVVGEHSEDKTQLLVIDDDGQFYRYDPAHEQLFVIEPDEQWELISDSEELMAGIHQTDS